VSGVRKHRTNGETQNLILPNIFKIVFLTPESAYGGTPETYLRLKA
jgi:hypothetical protein